MFGIISFRKEGNNATFSDQTYDFQYDQSTDSHIACDSCRTHRVSCITVKMLFREYVCSDDDRSNVTAINLGVRAAYHTTTSANMLLLSEEDHIEPRSKVALISIPDLEDCPLIQSGQRWHPDATRVACRPKRGLPSNCLIMSLRPK